MTHLGEGIKKLGFGLMRLPKEGDAIDIEQTKRISKGAEEVPSFCEQVHRLAHGL